MSWKEKVAFDESAYSLPDIDEEIFSQERAPVQMILDGPTLSSIQPIKEILTGTVNSYFIGGIAILHVKLYGEFALQGYQHYSTR